MRFTRTATASTLAVTIALGGAITLASPAQAAPAQSSSALTAKSANTCPTWTVMSKAVNFRSGPSSSKYAKGVVYRGDYGKKIDRSGSWIKLKLGKKSRGGLPKGSTGWVHRAYLDQCVYMNLD